MHLSETPFVIVDTETTGVRASNDRLIEIAAVKQIGGETIDEFSMLINPEQTIPHRITQITGITTSMVYDQPTIGEVMPAFLDFLGDGVFVAHNLSFDMGFINAELGRLDAAPISNVSLCTLRLARRLLRGLRSKGLSSLINFYNISIENRHRALGDARATAVVLKHFIEQVIYEHGIAEREELLRFQFVSYARKRGVSKNVQRIRDTILPTLPRTPGVYFMKDRKGQIIYVGKAKNLKARVRSYFNAIEAHATRTRNLVDAVADISWTPLHSELEALVKESHLIKQHKPKFNRAQKYYRNRPFLRLSVDELFPRMTLNTYLVDDGAAYFGPMASRRQGELIMDLINRFFLLRECDDTTFNRKTSCLYEDLQRCKAPCEAREKSPEWYAHEVERVKAFLMGNGGDDVLPSIEAAMKQAAQEMEFEQAAHYRDLIELVEGLLEKQRYIAAPVLEHNAVVIDRTIQDGHWRVLFVRFGRLVDSTLIPAPPEEPLLTELSDRIDSIFGSESERPDRYFKAEIEDIRLLAQWLFLNRAALDKVDWHPSLDLAAFKKTVFSLLIEGVK